MVVKKRLVKIVRLKNGCNQQSRSLKGLVASGGQWNRAFEDQEGFSDESVRRQAKDGENNANSIDRRKPAQPFATRDEIINATTDALFEENPNNTSKEWRRYQAAWYKQLQENARSRAAPFSEDQSNSLSRGSHGEDPKRQKPR